MNEICILTHGMCGAEDVMSSTHVYDVTQMPFLLHSNSSISIAIQRLHVASWPCSPHMVGSSAPALDS